MCQRQLLALAGHSYGSGIPLGAQSIVIRSMLRFMLKNFATFSRTKDLHPKKGPLIRRLTAAALPFA